MASSNPLDPSAVLARLPALLPQDSKKLSSQTEAIAALLHTVLTLLDFRLIAVDDDAPASSYESNALPAAWTAHGPGSYTLRYRHTQSSLEFVLKVSKLAGRTVVNGISTETEKITSLDVQTKDFTSQSFFPHETSSNEPLVHGFISSSRVADLISSFKLQIISKLLPGLRKDGYQDSEPATVAPATSGPSRRQQPPPAQPDDPDPFNPGRLYQPPPRPNPNRNPLEIGRSDLDPFPNPLAPPRPLFGGADGDGMYVGPNHPIFGGGIGGAPRRGGDGYLPPMAAPPGARFDEIVPPFGGAPGVPRAPLRRGEPDNDEFMPPRQGSGNPYDDMFS